MKCIAESGSTKTTWVIIDHSGKELYRSACQGLNPFFVDSPEVAEAFSTSLPSRFRNEMDALFFYGAGCSSEVRKQRIKDGILSAAPNLKIEVEHDLLAAARATCKKRAGIACILGTGSNSCEYDGRHIVDNIHAMGFMIGDEGSGTDLGRRLLQAWVYREMPKDLELAFQNEYDLTVESVLNALYYQPKPNKFLASFAKFCGDHRQHPLIAQIIQSALEGFVLRHVMKYDSVKHVPIHFVGSIAHHFKNELEQIFVALELTLGIVEPAPIEELIKYHSIYEV